MTALRTLAMLVFVGCLGGAGCTWKNEGAIDYGRLRNGGGDSAKAADTVVVKKYAAEKDARFILKDDTISVYLKQAYIASFFELPRYTQGERIKTTRGEIAIVAKVFEQSDTADVDFTTKATQSGRLIYYGDDVRRGQYLNLSFLPVYGPRKYNGGPLILQLYILELDQGGQKQLSSLMSALASVGSVAYPAASPILGLLDSLGTALLQRNTDDIIFRYHMTLLPLSKQPGVSYPVLEAGDYLFLRRENRQEPSDFDQIRYDPATGRISCVSLVGKTGPVETVGGVCQHTSLVMTILKDACKGVELDTSKASLEKFLTAEFAESQDGKTVAALGATVTQYLTQRAHDQRLGDLQRQINVLSAIDCAANASFCAPPYGKLATTLAKEVADYKKGAANAKKAVPGALTKEELESVIASVNGLKYFSSTITLDGFDASALRTDINAKLAGGAAQ